MRRWIMRRRHCNRLVARAARFWRDVNRHFETASMRVRIKWCASEAIRHVGAPDAICCVVQAAHNAFVDRVRMMKAALVIRHFSAPFFIHARQDTVTAQLLLDGSAFGGA